MTNYEVVDTLTIFYCSGLIFCCGYRISCWFFPEPYEKHIYFGGNWKNIHSKDEILWYFMIGAGSCVLINSICF